MSNNTKKWIKAMRNVLLFLRVLELNGAIGILVLMILISNIDQLTGWIMRVAVSSPTSAAPLRSSSAKLTHILSSRES